MLFTMHFPHRKGRLWNGPNVSNPDNESMLIFVDRPRRNNFTDKYYKHQFFAEMGAASILLEIGQIIFNYK